MIHRIKKLADITFEGIAGAGIVSALCPKHLRQFLDAFMRALAHAARERGRDKGRLKNRINYSKNGVVQDAVPHRCLVYPAQLRVAYPKTAIRPMLVSLALQFSMQLKNLPLDILFYFHHVRLVPLVAFEYLSRCKEVLCGNY